MIIHRTGEIRRKPPIRCAQHNQRCHIVGLNLAKQLLNYYAEKRQVVVSEAELDQWVQDLNLATNFYCCSPERNTLDKYTEAELLHMLLGEEMGPVREQGPWPTTLDQLSPEARTMYDALKALIHGIQDHLSAKGRSSSVVDSIQEDLETGTLPLRLYCFECHSMSVTYREGTRLFCDIDCHEAFYLNS